MTHNEQVADEFFERLAEKDPGEQAEILRKLDDILRLTGEGLLTDDQREALDRMGGRWVTEFLL